MVEEQERQREVVLDPGGLIIVMSLGGMVALVIVARCLKQQDGNLAIARHSLIGWHPEDDASRWIASCQPATLPWYAFQSSSDGYFISLDLSYGTS
jgi:hypothetical protein